MAIATQTLPSIAGTPPAFAAPAVADTVEIGTILIVKNGGGASVTVTFVTPATLPTGDAYPDKAYTVPAAGERWIPVLADYRSPAGVADVTFSTVASVTVAAVNRA